MHKLKILFKTFGSLIASCLFLSAAALALPPTPSDLEKGVAIRSFLYDLVSASGHEAAQRPPLIRKVFADHPEVFRWIAESDNIDQLWATADLGEIKPSVLAKKEISRTLQAECQKAVAEWTKDATFAAQLSEKVSARLSELKTKPEIQELVRKNSSKALQYFSKLSPDDRIKLLQLVNDKSAQSLAEQIDKKIAETRLSDSDAIHLLISDKTFKLKPNSGIKAEEIQRYLSAYFDNLGLTDRRRLFLGLLKLPPHSQVEKELAAVLQNSGPGIQKMMQLVGKDSPDPFVRAVMHEFLENNSPVPFDEVRKIVENQLKKSGLGNRLEDIFESFSEKPLGTGTVGQTHFARLKPKPGEKVGAEITIKIRHPGVVEKFQREIEVITKAAEGTDFAKIVPKIRESLEREMDFRLEAENLRKGFAVYHDPKHGISVAQLIEDFPNSEELMATRLANGKSLAKLDKAGAAWRGKATDQLIRNWFRNVIFGRGEFAGYFHGDLHPGNQFLERIVKHENVPNFNLTLIDFGNAGTITLEQRRGFIHMAIGALAESPEQMLYSLEKLGSIPPENKAALLETLRATDWSKLTCSKRISRILLVATDHGMEIPTDFLGFKRGMEFLEDIVEELNKRMDKLDPGGKKLPRIHPTRIYAEVSAKELAIDIPKQLVSATARKESPASLGEIIRALLRSAPAKINSYTVHLGQCVRSLTGHFLTPPESKAP